MENENIHTRKERKQRKGRKEKRKKERKKGKKKENESKWRVNIIEFMCRGVTSQGGCRCKSEMMLFMRYFSWKGPANMAA